MNIRLHQLARTTALAAFTLGTTLAVTGCATTEGANKKEKALVCPQCKMVAVQTVQPAANAQAGWSGRLQPTTVYRDQCPGCQGAIETFFREGKWKHKCSVCKDSPYTCPVFHPSPTR
jgi:hypothetical protein